MLPMPPRLTLPGHKWASMTGSFLPVPTVSMVFLNAFLKVLMTSAGLVSVASPVLDPPPPPCQLPLPHPTQDSAQAGTCTQRDPAPLPSSTNSPPRLVKINDGPPPSPANLPPPRIFPISAFSSLPAPATPTPYRAHLRKKPAPSSRRSPFMPRRKTMSASFPPPRIFATTVPTPSFLPVPLPWSPLLPKPPASPFARAPSRPRLLPLAPRLPRPCASTAFPLPPRPPFPRPRPLLLPLPKPVQAGILLQKNCSQIPKTPKQTANQPTHE